MSASRQNFSIEWHRNVAVIIPPADIEKMQWNLMDEAAEAILAPLSKTKAPMLIFDLKGVSFFGSIFMSLLLRCHKFVKTRGGDMVLSGASNMARELLGVTALDTLWALYDTREEALDAVGM